MPLACFVTIEIRVIQKPDISLLVQLDNNNIASIQIKFGM